MVSNFTTTQMMSEATHKSCSLMQHPVFNNKLREAAVIKPGLHLSWLRVLLLGRCNKNLSVWLHLEAKVLYTFVSKFLHLDTGMPSSGHKCTL
ncbi:hypothetical protein GUJ93_ZPchr0012g19475 [Zizania palustris]|uniref:Uncharacterized protein n=1 Tax=Zizania palustris TaxID=103762 RepID=A0A8J6BRX2_ZIZPA|nr:hypothetical protein GUJ93_ZPchr0012g19475 [Zizania palustris]